MKDSSNVRIRLMTSSDIRRLSEIDSNFESPVYLDVVKEADGLNVSWRLIERSFGTPVARTNFDFDEKEQRAIRQRSKTKDGLWLVAENTSAGRLVGMVDVAREDWREAGFVWNLAVDRACRGLGIGNSLMDRVVAWGRREGLRAIILETQTNNWYACRFYQEFGFQLTGINDHYYTNRDLANKEVALFGPMSSDQVDVAARRARLERAGFLSLTEPRDALATYYALYHDPNRTQLWLHSDADDRIDGLLAVCQTGFSLFQPTVVLRSRYDEVAVSLLHKALLPGRPYYVVTTPTLSPAVRSVVQMEQDAFNRIYRFDPRRHQPEINVLVQPASSPAGSPRFVIRSRDEIASDAGISWRSPHFAEVFVHTQPWARGRGWGKAVVAACAATLLQSGVQPLYMVAEENEASIRLAESVGFVDTGAREFAGSGVCL